MSESLVPPLPGTESGNAPSPDDAGWAAWVEALTAVRERAGSGWTVGCRHLSDEIIEGGSALDDAVFFGVELACAGMDFLSLSRGGKFEDAQQPRVGQAAYPYTGPSGWECTPTAIGDARGPFGRNIEPARVLRDGLRAAGQATPVVVTGGIHSFAQAEEILASGAADIVGAARQSLADPDWWEKVRLGRGGSALDPLVRRHPQNRVALEQPPIPLGETAPRRRPDVGIESLEVELQPPQLPDVEALEQIVDPRRVHPRPRPEAVNLERGQDLGAVASRRAGAHGAVSTSAVDACAVLFRRSVACRK